MKKRTFTLHQQDGSELLIPFGAFDYAIKEPGENVLVSICGETYCVEESLAEIQEILDSEEEE